MATNSNGKKALIGALAIAAATFVKHLVTALIARVIDWAKARWISDKPGQKT